MSIAALAGIVAQTPAGALIDKSTAKRGLMVAAAIVVTLTCLVLPSIHRFEWVAATQALAACAWAIFAPAVAAVTLGIVGPKRRDAAAGRPETCFGQPRPRHHADVCLHHRGATGHGAGRDAGRKADAWGRKPIFAVALAVLALRGALYPLSDNPYWLVSVQLLDRVGAGIFGALFPLVVADLTRGTGRFNVS